MQVFAFSQDKSKKEKQKNNKKTELVEIKANLTVLDDAGNFVSEIEPDDLRIFEDGIEQKMIYFAKKNPKLNLAFVFDNTGSMRKNNIVIDKVPTAFTDILTSKDEFFVLRFVDSSNVQIIQDWTSSKKDFNEAFGQTYIEGGQSAVLDAIYLSAEKLLEREKKDKNNRYAIILISDAEDVASYYDISQVRELIKDSDLQVFVLSFAENAPNDKKKARLTGNILALETGGTIYALPKKFVKEDIINALKSIDKELRSPYIIGYTSTNQNRDGLPRKITVQIADNKKGEKRQGIIRDGFVVPKN